MDIWNLRCMSELQWEIQKDSWVDGSGNQKQDKTLDKHLVVVGSYGFFSSMDREFT